jgi:hypothetical protein
MMAWKHYIGQFERFCPVRDLAPIDFQGFPPLPSSLTLDKKNSKPRSPTTVGFSDKQKNQ